MARKRVFYVIFRPGHGLRQPPMCWMIDVSEDIRIVPSDL
ncbi:hypothetical protein SXCC_00715 [Gluconacetobacter sp. SXCC-1]|nr:hypothetical protein SXCC_00715 [Gluconacetobacter sp. SXCC-1]